MKDLYDRLGAAGYDRTFVRSCLLPDWWDDSLAAVAANRAHAEALIARQLGFTLSSVRDPDAQLTVAEEVNARYKTRQGTAIGDLAVASALGARIARIAALCASSPFDPGDTTAGTIRSTILSEGAPWVGLEELLRYCWRIGIPVLHLRTLPRGAKKMDGLVVWAEGRPVIVIASRHRYPAWQLFILAHELGHVGLGHVAPATPFLVDRDVSPKASAELERAANSFAVELLTGDPYTAYRPVGRWLTGLELARSAELRGREWHINPGVIALNYAWSQQFFQVGMAALNKLEPDGDAPTNLRSHYANLDLELVPEDTRRFFQCLTHCV